MQLYKDAQNNVYGVADESILTRAESIMVYNEKGEEFLLPIKEAEKLKIDCSKDSGSCAPPACAPSCAPHTFINARRPPRWSVYSF
jgi:hypothetical protein